MDRKAPQTGLKEPELRVVLLGKTGVGKSASGNAILGSNRFTSERSPSSVTVKCQKETGQFGGKPVAVVDTPGLFHTDKSPKEVMKEIQRGVKLIKPGPHVFLLVLRLDRFSGEDNRTLEAFKNVFQDAKHHTVVLFTREDKCEEGHEGFIESHEDLKRFLTESCEGHHVFNNRVQDESRVTDLLNQINKIKRERGFYSSEKCKNALNALEKEMQSSEGGSDRWYSEFLSAVDDPIKYVNEKLEVMTVNLCQKTTSKALKSD